MKEGLSFQNMFMWLNSRKLCFKLNLEKFSPRKDNENNYVICIQYKNHNYSLLRRKAIELV